MPKRNGFGELIGTFDFIELRFNRLSKQAIVTVFQNKQRLWNFAKLFQWLANQYLPRY